MDNRELNFTALDFHRTSHSELRPPIFDGDHTWGHDFASGQLVSLQHAKKALLLVVRFTGGPDAKTVGWRPQDDGEVEFLLLERNGRYVGGITRQTPNRFCWLSGEQDGVAILDGLGHGPGGGGRRIAHFFCHRSLPSYSMSIELSVTVYIGLGWFRRWKEVVVEVPKKDLYVAYP